MKYALRYNNELLMNCLGNLFPFNFEINSKYFSIGYSDNFKKLLNKITGDNLVDFFINYVSKSINKKISSNVQLLITNYGLVNDFIGNVDVICNNGKVVIGNGDKVFVISNKKQDFYVPKKDVYTILSRLTENRFFKKWEKLYESLAFEYNPIRPYDMEISDNNFDKHGGHTIIDRDHHNVSKSSSENEVIDDTTENSYQGFNSNSYNPVDKSKNTSKDVSENSEKVDIDAQIDTTHGRTVESTRNITRSGNIGNITQQELIERERNLWEYQIYDVMFRDLDSIYVRAKYM